jgi:hypothetical protein
MYGVNTILKIRIYIVCTHHVDFCIQTISNEGFIWMARAVTAPPLTHKRLRNVHLSKISLERARAAAQINALILILDSPQFLAAPPACSAIQSRIQLPIVWTRQGGILVVEFHNNIQSLGRNSESRSNAPPVARMRW